MKRLLSLLAVVAVAGCGDEGGSSRQEAYKPPSTAKPGAKPDRGDFVLRLERARGDDGDAKALLEAEDPQILVDNLNANFRLPRDIEIVFETGEGDEDTSPYYDLGDGNIHVPYEFFYETVGIFLATGSNERRALTQAVETLEFVLYHEVGHALTDALDIPITGREEDAVDGLATAILTLAIRRGAQSVLTAAEWFAALSELGGNTIGAEQFADVHSLEDQRFFSLLCWVYGSAPNRYAGIVERGELPKSRAAGCPEEYLQNVESWVELLDPWLKD